jgi:hypothetical protein
MALTKLMGKFIIAKNRMVTVINASRDTTEVNKENDMETKKEANWEMIEAAIRASQEKMEAVHEKMRTSINSNYSILDIGTRWK